MIEEALLTYIDSPRVGINNFTLGQEYEKHRQLAAAIGFYIRTAEFGDDKLLSYEALLRVAICFEAQGKRVSPLKGAILRAISVMPDRPEGYFLMTRTYEQNKNWHEAYAWSFIGEKIARGEKELKPLISDVLYQGVEGFIFERAVVGWWIGLYTESLDLFKYLEKNFKMAPIYQESINNNIINVTNILKDKGIIK